MHVKLVQYLMKLFHNTKIYCAVFRCRFLNGNALVFWIDCLMLLLFRQFPFESSNHMFPMRRSVSLFLANSMVVGLSLVPPDCRCMPKYFSRGSWQMRLLKKHVTPGILKTKVYSSKNEETMHKTIENIKIKITRQTC